MSPFTVIVILAGLVSLGYFLFKEHDMQEKLTEVSENVKNIRHSINPDSPMKVVAFVPIEQAGLVRYMVAQTGAEAPDFSSKERIEVLCTRKTVDSVVQAIQNTPLSEAVNIDVYPLGKYQNKPH